MILVQEQLTDRFCSCEWQYQESWNCCGTIESNYHDSLEQFAMNEQSQEVHEAAGWCVLVYCPSQQYTFAAAFAAPASVSAAAAAAVTCVALY